MEKQTQLPFWLFGCGLFSAMLHYLLVLMLQMQEIFFFYSTLILFLAFVISLMYNILSYTTKGTPKDIWKMAWLGVFGLFGVFAAPLFGLFGFFGFFGLKK